MSLLKLLNWHYFTVQTNEAVINEGGALNRRDGWLNLYENLKGHLQSQPGQRNDEVLDYKRAELEIRHILWHNYTNKEINKSKRILVWSNPKLKIQNYKDVNNIRIFKITSIKEPVAIRGKKIIFELHLEEVIKPRQSV